MQIITSSNIGFARDALLDYVRRQKQQTASFQVLDIGGAHYPWTKPVVDTFVDMFAMDGTDVIVGDINEPEVWDEIGKRHFDFCICSHTLEDIRNPIFVLKQMQKSFDHGYIAVPNKHVEFNNIESTDYVGYGHHRWIFSLERDRLKLIAKFPLASRFSPRRRLSAKIKASPFAKTLRRLRHTGPRLSDLGPLPWWDKSRAGRYNELAFIWSGELSFTVINGDYAGDTMFDLGRLYCQELADGL